MRILVGNPQRTVDHPVLRTAARADAFLSKNGIILRGVASYGLPNALRMTVGTQEQNELAVSLIQQFIVA